uniref:Putative salivary secreted peptide n=1 Tax=Toxorhynchites amboinensis TaxID=46208 RepID=A0FIV1_TOXAM|nr:putative salivary secreted peptide [Toxorhynchites amboinensis]
MKSLFVLILATLLLAVTISTVEVESRRIWHPIIYPYAARNATSDGSSRDAQDSIAFQPRILPWFGEVGERIPEESLQIQPEFN